LRQSRCAWFLSAEPSHQEAHAFRRGSFTLLIEHGADVNLSDGNLAPLHEAALWNTSEEALLLILNGASIEARNGAGFSPLHFAAMHACYEVAELLLLHHADVNAEGIGVPDTIPAGQTPLHLAAGNKLNGTTHEIIKLIELLVKNGAEVNAVDEKGQTPLDLNLKRFPNPSVEDALRRLGAKRSNEIRELS
jgi:ankyrin repeat protein